MNIEVSIGEAIDKYNILEIKLEKITNELKKAEIMKEIAVLKQSCEPIIEEYPEFYRFLTVVNTEIWDLSDEIKETDTNDKRYSTVSCKIFDLNQKRFRVKTFFNKITNSKIKEQKGYSETCCLITISSLEVLYNKIPEINYISLDYDHISFDIPDGSIIKDIFKQPNIIYPNYDKSLVFTSNIRLEEFSISTTEKLKYAKTPITYLAGGLLGDFIHGISVINENFLKTGKRGILLFSDGFGGDNFRMGVENTFIDIFETISQQIYIENFRIYNNERYDINLNDWRSSDLLYKATLPLIYEKTYNVKWGSHPWLKVGTNEAWKNKVVINTSRTRFPPYFPSEILKRSLVEVVFVSFESSEYEYFKLRTGLDNIPYYKSVSFSETCEIINSCFLFVGSLSSPLSIAHALNRSRSILLSGQNDDIMIKGINSFWNNCEIYN